MSETTTGGGIDAAWPLQAPCGHADALAALIARLAAVEAERDEAVEDADEARLACRQADAAARRYAAQDGRWRVVVGALLTEWDLLARLYSDGDVLAIDRRAWDVAAQAQAALDGPPPPTRWAPDG